MIGYPMIKRAFEIVDHTADVGIVAYGADVQELFSNAALGLFTLITEPGRIEQRLHLELEVSSEDREGLLVEWLNELIYLFDSQHILFSRFDIESLTQNKLRATCYGEGFDSTKHEVKTGVKAATYHMLRLDKNGDGYRAQIIFDI
jgi:SHS2 domain-containing protein